MTTFRKLSIASLVATLTLIGIGGLVRATKSGLGCGTDWPRCSGKLVPALETRATVIEYSHRLVAVVVIVLLAVLVVAAARRHRDRPRLLWPAVASLAVVLSQAVVGAVVVKLELEAESVAVHLGIAMILVAILSYLVAAGAVVDGGSVPATDRAAARELAGAAAAVLLLLLVGSYVSGKDAGLAFQDWPLMDGRLIPRVSSGPEAIHFVHRMLAGAVGVVVFVTAWRVGRRSGELPGAACFARLAGALFLVEVLIGAANVFSDLNPVFVSAHLLVGALIWGSLVAASVSASPMLGRVAEDRRTRRTRPAEVGG